MQKRGKITLITGLVVLIFLVNNVNAQECLNLDEINNIGGDWYEGLLKTSAFVESIEVYFSCLSGPACGNGFIEEGEECDDNNVISGDGCDPSCQVEDSWICNGEVPTLCTPIQIELEEIASGLESPVFVTHAGDGSGMMFIVEQAGRILIFDGTVLSTPFLDITSIVRSGGERGLLSVAFHPNYEINGKFYVDYTREPDGATIVSEYLISSDSNVVNLDTERILLVILQPTNVHNGGQLQFGPDGYLYIGMGDGGSNINGQNIDTLLGALLRIDVDNQNPGLEYAVPFDNPFVGIDGRDEIYAYGLRNPWRFSFDSNGRLFLADVGQFDWEEVDLIVNGGNYGWKIMEGAHCFFFETCDQTGLILPVEEYPHAPNFEECSVTGGYVYEGMSVTNLHGAYIYGDFCSGRIWALHEVISGTWASSELLNTPYSISSFGEDENEEIYVISLFGGKMYRINGA